MSRHVRVEKQLSTGRVLDPYNWERHSHIKLERGRATYNGRVRMIGDITQLDTVGYAGVHLPAK